MIRETLGGTSWKALVRSFYANHRSRTPLFTEIAAEFVGFIQETADSPETPPWLPELAHYEWAEQALFISEAQTPAHDPDGDLLNGVPLLSPLALPLAYRWPVAEIGPSNRPDTLPAAFTTLLVHRDADHQVHFARITPLAYRLLVALSDRRTGRQHLAALAGETGGDPNEIAMHGLALLEQLRSQGIVLGTSTGQEVDDL